MTQSLFLCLSVRWLMLWYICRCLKKRKRETCAWVYCCLILQGKAILQGVSEKSKFKSTFGEFSEIEMHEGNAVQATNTHTHTHTRECCSVLVSPVVGVVVPGEDICYSVSGPRSSFSTMRGCRGAEPPQRPLLPATISQALTSCSAAVCFKASN